MLNFRLDLAQEVAEQIKARVLAQFCSVCRMPLMAEIGQEYPFCWYCEIDRRSAQQSRTVLTKAKLAARGFIIENIPPRLPAFRGKKEVQPARLEGWAL